MRKVIMALAATLVLAGCGEGETYPLGASEVRAKLLEVRPPEFIFGDGKGVNTMAAVIGNDQVRWTVLADGKPMVRLTATLTAKGDKSTAVALVAEPVEGQADKVLHNVATTSDALGLYKAALAEQIDARLENRSFNTGAIQGQMAGSMGTTFKQVDASLDNAVKEFDARDRERADAAFDRESNAAINGDSGFDPTPAE